jgi:hypothetical protein
MKLLTKEFNQLKYVAWARAEKYFDIEILNY